MSYLDILKESLLNKPSGAMSRLAQTMLQKESSDSLTVLRGIDNKDDNLGSVQEDQKSPSLTVQDLKDGQSTLVTIGESETPKGTTLSRIQITEQQRLDREANNATRNTTTNYSASNLSGPVVAAAKYLMPVIASPLVPLSTTVSSLMTLPKITEAAIPAITSSEESKSTNPVSSFISNSYKTLQDFLAKKEETKPEVTSFSFGSNFDETLSKANTNKPSLIAESTNRNFTRNIIEQQRTRQDADKKSWEQNQQMTRAIEAVQRKAQEKSMAATNPKKKKECRTSNIDGYLKSLAAMAGIDLSSHCGISPKELSGMLLNRGTSPYVMMSIFEKMGKNFLSTLSILEKSGNQHLFGQAIAKGLDVSSTAAADQFALELNTKSKFRSFRA